MAVVAVAIDQEQVVQVAQRLSGERRERLRRAEIALKETVLIEAVEPTTVRVPVPGKAAWPGGPRRPTFATDPSHETVELPSLERFDVRVVRTAQLIEEEVRRFWYESGRRPVAVCVSPLRLLSVGSAHWQRYPVLLIGSLITVQLIALPTLGDDEAQAALALEPGGYPYTILEEPSTNAFAISFSRRVCAYSNSICQWLLARRKACSINSSCGRLRER